MSHWYEVFDNEEVQLQARRQAAQLTALAVATILLTFTLTALGIERILPLPAVAGLLLAIWFGTVWWIGSRMRRLRRIVWCIKLSEERVVGYDYTRRKAVLAWDQIHRVELTPNGLLLTGAAPFSFEIPHLFPDFATLSHRIVHYAEQHGVPVLIDGKPWEAIDVYRLFPFLADDTSGTAA